ncbi:MAG: GAF domain-containing protein [Deltaproteobacteria bacterium]|nr:GAF domain-containing protein [Deltaproteobacteria bacterium]
MKDIKTSPHYSKKIRLVAPNEIAVILKDIKNEINASVEIVTYSSLDSGLFNSVFKERIILYCHTNDLTKDRIEKIISGKELAGCMVIATTEKDMEDRQLPFNRKISIVPETPGKQLIRFHTSKSISEIQFAHELEFLRQADQKQRDDLEALNEIGMALSTEKDLDRLLDLIVSKSRQMTWADAGSLYLMERDPNKEEDKSDYFADKRMRFQISQNDSRSVPFRSLVVDIKKSSIYGYVGLTQEHLNFTDVYHIPKEMPYGWGGREFDAAIKYRTMSMLTVPMVNWRGETIGVIQLINRKTDPTILLDDPETCVKDIRPFTNHDVRMAMSIASQASIAIQNTELVNSIRTLFEGFIKASVKAIESRDPTTGGHSQRVADLTVALAEQVDRKTDGVFKADTFSREQLQEIRYASLLHDFGKIGVREHVLVKAKKLYPDELRTLQDRFELIRTTIALKFARRKAELLAANDKSKMALAVKTDEEMQEELRRLEEINEFILKCNEPAVLDQGGFERLTDIAEYKFSKLGGEENAYLSEKEMLSLSVRKGSLTEQDRKEIESHVTHTYKFLTTIPWTSDLRNVPEIAYAHHEKLDGTGYPNKLKSEQIPIQSKMMTISDIYDALTAMDRPYKKALPPERALSILMEESKAQHVDAELLDMFITAEIFKVIE